jgi:uncharacterized membrane protein
MAQVAEFQSWKRFRAALPRSQRKAFDEMLDEARHFTSASSMAVRTSVFEGVFMAILFQHYKEIDSIFGDVNGDKAGEGEMSLDDGDIAREARSWEAFAGALREKDRDLFRRMLASARENAPAMQARASPFPVESLFMSILLAQHRLIEKLQCEDAKHREAAPDEGLDT